MNASSISASPKPAGSVANRSEIYHGVESGLLKSGKNSMVKMLVIMNTTMQYNNMLKYLLSYFLCFASGGSSAIASKVEFK